MLGKKKINPHRQNNNHKDTRTYKNHSSVTGTERIFDKGALTWYAKLTQESAHAWNLIILC